MTAYEFLDLIITLLGFAGTILAVVVAYRQLHRMADSAKAAENANEISIFKALLEMEGQISERRVRLSESSVTLTEIKSKSDKGELVSKTDVDIAKLIFDEARENYLNGFDRLCACFLRGIVKESEYKADYRKSINELVEQHRDLLGVGTRFRNIVKVHDKWADEN